jgi:hypothetical protein
MENSMFGSLADSIIRQYNVTGVTYISGVCSEVAHLIIGLTALVQKLSVDYGEKLVPY